MVTPGLEDFIRRWKIKEKNPLHTKYNEQFHMKELLNDFHYYSVAGISQLWKFR